MGANTQTPSPQHRAVGRRDDSDPADKEYDKAVDAVTWELWGDRP